MVNTVGCTGKSAKDLYTAVAQELGWREVEVEPSVPAGGHVQKRKSTIFCVTQTAEAQQRLPLIGPHSWVSRYLGCPDLCDKGNFARMVMAVQEFCAPEDFDFIPATWVLPDQMESLHAAMAKSKKTFILKPQDGAQGDGISLVRNPRDLVAKLAGNFHKAAVVQRYIEKPLLLHGIKFDLRLYVLLAGGSKDSAPQVFVCKEGLARFCTERYEEPAASNMHKCMSHLTNYSLNKRSSQFEHAGESMEEVFDIHSTASKRPLTAVLKQMELDCPDFSSRAFYDGVARLVQKCCALMAPALCGYHRAHGDGEIPCFQMLGFDIILDEKFKPHLLEINNSPSLCIDEAFPLDPGSVASPGTAHGRPRTQEKGRVCHCMDLHMPHYHQTALVDLVVKRTAMCGAFQMLRQLSQGAEVYDDAFFPVDAGNDGLYDMLHSVESFFNRCGGTSKAFTSGALRRHLGAACGQGHLQKLDLDTLSQKYRASVGQFTTYDTAGKPETLRLFDFLDLLRVVGEKAFSGLAPRQALDQLLHVVGAA